MDACNNDAAPQATQLPQDAWVHVFRKLPLASLARMQCVSRGWRALCQNVGLPPVCIVHALQLSRSFLLWLAAWPLEVRRRVTELRLAGGADGGRISAQAAYLGCRVSFMLGLLPGLTVLSVASAEMQAFALDLLPPGIERLSLHIGLSHSIQSCAFPLLPRLRALDLRISMTESFEPATDDGCVVYPPGMQASLRRLTVRDHCADDQILPPAAALGALRQLDVVTWVLPKASVDDIIATLPRLVAVNLRVACMDPSEVEGLARMGSLRELHIETTTGSMEDGAEHHLRPGKSRAWRERLGGRGRGRAGRHSAGHVVRAAHAEPASARELPPEWRALAQALGHLRVLEIRVLDANPTRFMRRTIAERFPQAAEVDED